MAGENVTEFTAALAGEATLSGLLTAMVPGLQEISGPQLTEGFGELASPADRAVLKDAELADYVAAMFRSGLRAGIAGWRDDDLAFVRDWGFSPHGPASGAPVAVWQGDEDRMVPFTHGTWLATHIPAARVHHARGAGHMNLPLADVVDELLELAG